MEDWTSSPTQVLSTQNTSFPEVLFSALSPSTSQTGTLFSTFCQLSIPPCSPAYFALTHIKDNSLLPLYSLWWLIEEPKDFPGDASGKEPLPLTSAGERRDLGSMPWSGRSPGGGHGNPLQYSFLEYPTDREAWRATVHRVKKNWAWLKQLGMHTEEPNNA